MRDDVSIVLCGEAGQGLKTVESVLTGILKIAGFNVFSTKEYMSRVRGGVNTTSIRVSSEPVYAFVDRIDILIPLSLGRTKHLNSRISEKTVILGEKTNISEECNTKSCRIIEAAYTLLAKEAGNQLYSNVVAVGVVCGIFDVEINIIEGYIKKYFSKKEEKIIKENIDAALKGHQKGRELVGSKEIITSVKKDDSVKGQLVLDGAEAMALGAIAGGCNFISAYPMTPSTGVLTYLSKHAGEFGIVAEQAEDEISAINMALGAWYAGARALASTAGGGFALMVEGLSLAGMLEMPVVINVGMRPAPATGLPTRTEQGDLNFVLNAGHGEFPRMIFTPGTLEDLFYLTQNAFNLADKYQMPIIILTDQYLMDSYYNMPQLKTENLKIEQHVVKTGEAYKRYVLNKSGISPRGIPGFGDGLVCVDSDEHDEEGHITEDLGMRNDMVEKRLKKLGQAQADVLEPKLTGLKTYKTLVVSWGSTYHIIKEALGRLDRQDISFLHFSQVHPLHANTIKYLKKAKQVIAIENNATSQFADLIKVQTGFEIKDRINKYNGLSFSVEEIVEAVNSILGEQ